ncbi:MAG: glycoside hydrolase family 16 protein [Lentimicrobium sp.]|nr:glycoside hydrolase family 16 protein [Lentimicrobium sp.]
MKKISFLFLIFCLFITELYGQSEYQLVWFDDFNYNDLSLSKDWDHNTGSHGWGNNELQNYTISPENSFIENGVLFIRAKKSDDQWTSARLTTKNKQDFLYGRIEVRAKLPKGLGTWPAIWMLPTEKTYGGWPECGEIDIMEHVGFDPGVVHGTIHTGDYNHLKNSQLGNSLLIKDFSETFHLYAIEWNETKIDFFIDKQKYFTFLNDFEGDIMTWPFDQKFHIILNVAIGGNWGGRKGVDPGLTEAIMEIDFVRVYQKK